MWRPRAGEFGRALRCTAFFLSPAGEFVRRELAGPTCLADWERAWRVFTVAMEVLSAATRTRLRTYADRIRAASADYPNFWWIIALADAKMRKAHIERIRRRAVADHFELTAAGIKSQLDPSRPWDVAFRDAAKDSDYWAKEVDLRVVQFTTHQRSRAQIADPGFGDLRFAAGGGGAKRARSGGGDSSDGGGGGTGAGAVVEVGVMVDYLRRLAGEAQSEVEGMQLRACKVEEMAL